MRFSSSYLLVILNRTNAFSAVQLLATVVRTLLPFPSCVLYPTLTTSKIHVCGRVFVPFLALPFLPLSTTLGAVLNSCSFSFFFTQARGLSSHLNYQRRYPRLRLQYQSRTRLFVLQIHGREATITTTTATTITTTTRAARGVGIYKVCFLHALFLILIRCVDGNTGVTKNQTDASGTVTCNTKGLF